MVNKQLVLATSNKGKILELTALLQPLDYTIVPQADLGISDADETGLSFVENALIKARHAAKISGLPAIADDSGLVVPILNGTPGIYSARYAGKNATAKENIAALTSALKDIPDDKRSAYFYCVLIFIKHAADPTPIIAEGKCAGTILSAAISEGGFGYDPIFFLPHLQKTMADLTVAEKNRLSHRGLALQSLLKRLADAT